jgi:hypothetical protein
MKRLVLVGLALTVLVTAVLRWAAGPQAIVPGLVFGALATGLQATAFAVVRPVLGAAFHRLLKRWAIGMALRLFGVAVFTVAVILDRSTFPPVPTAFGYIGVLLPLLFMETRLLR